MVAGTADLQTELDKHRQAVDTEYFDLSIREIVRMVEDEEIVVAPAYQRQFRWKEATQSALIESLLLGLPIPAIFVATNRDATWDIVDGLQRVATILRFFGIDAPNADKLQFAKDTLVLTGMNQLKGFEGRTYESLPGPIRLTLGKRYIRVQVLSDKSDASVRFELFRRLNAGAVALTPQEIRSCVFRGTFNTMIEELSENEQFKSLLKLQPKYQNDGTAVELVLKFFAYLNRFDTIPGKIEVTELLNSYMKERTNDTDLESDRKLFNDAVTHLVQVLKGAPFVPKRVSTTPINQLEGVLVGIAKVLQSGKPPVVPEGDWINDPKLVEFSTKGTNSRSNLRGRILRAAEIFS